MSRKKIALIVTIAGIAIVCLLLPMLFKQADEGSGGIKITLVAKSKTSNFWQTCFQGAEAAVAEYNNLELEIVGPDVEWDYETQNQYIEKAISEGCDAIVFSACDKENSVAAVEKALDTGVPVITIDSGVNTQRSITFIGMDNFEAGRKAASAVIESVGESAGVAIVSFEEASGNGAQRVEGFLDYIKEYPDITVLDIYYSKSDYDVAQEAAENMMETYGDELKAIATFNELTTVGVGRAVEATGDTDSLYVVGFDNNIESIRMMEEGYINSLIIQNPFAMGYLGVSQAIAEIEGRSVSEDIYTDTVIANKDNMYTVEMEKLLFPVSKR